MQDHGGVAAEDAITSVEREISKKVRVDWNKNGLYDHPLSILDDYVDSVSVNRALTGSAPEEITLIEGSSQAELSMTLTGSYDGIPLTAVFSPYATQSPLYGNSVVGVEVTYSILIETADGVIEYPQFVGIIREVTPVRGDVSVEISALDLAETLRKPVQLPPYAVAEEHLSYGKVDSQLVQSHWVIEHALNLSDAGSGDKRPTYREELGLADDSQDGVQVWISGNGSYLPTIGYLDNPGSDSFPLPGEPMYRRCGRRHPRCPPSRPKRLCFRGLGHGISQQNYKQDKYGVIRYLAADQDRINPAATHYLGFTLNTNGDGAEDHETIDNTMLLEIVLGMARVIQVWVGDNFIWTERRRYTGVSTFTYEGVSTPIAIPSGEDFVDVFVMWDNSDDSGSKCYVRCGDNATSGGWETKGSPVTSGSLDEWDQYKGRFTVGQALNLSDVFYATRNATSRPVDDFDQVYREPTNLALMDDGLNSFTFMPSSKKQEAWQLIQDVVSAEFGSAFWDEEGNFTFWNWETMLEKRDTPVRTFSLDDVEGLQFTNTWDSIRNVYAVTTKKRRALAQQSIYSASDVNEFYVAPRTEKLFVIWIDDAIAPITKFVPRYDSITNEPESAPPSGYDEWPDWDSAEVDHGYVIQYYDGSSWSEDPFGDSVEVRAYYTTDGYLTVRVKNDANVPIRLATGAEDENSSAALNIGGSPIESYPDSTLLYRNDESIAKYGAQILELSGDWYQDIGATEDLFEVLLPRTKDPSPTTDAITIPGDPRLQLGDVIVITDPEGFGTDIPLQIYGIERSLTRDEGLTDRLTVEVAFVPEEEPEPPVDPEEPVYVTRYNLSPNPACKTTRDKWFGGGGGSRITNITGMPRATGYLGNNSEHILPAAFRVTPGKTYIASCYVKSTSGSQTIGVNINWLSRWGYMSETAYNNYTVGTGSATRVNAPAVTAPNGAVEAFLAIEDADNNLQVSCVLVEEGTSVGTYFDGDSTGAVWDGAAGYSTSRIVEEV